MLSEKMRVASAVTGLRSAGTSSIGGLRDTGDSMILSGKGLASELMLFDKEWPRTVELLLSVSDEIIDSGRGMTSTVSEKSTVLDLYADIFSRRLGEAGGVLPVIETECLWLGLGRVYGNIISCGVDGFEGTAGARALASACCLIRSEVSMSETETACERLCI